MSNINNCADNTVLDIRNLSISFQQYAGRFSHTQLETIHNLNVKVHAGELVAIVGASGSGKSLLAHSILGILPYNATWSGEIRYRGELLTQTRIEELRGSEIALVPQGVSHLDPLMKIGTQILKGRKDAATRQKMEEVLERYGLGDGVENLYPFELSGGMARRALISMAVLEDAKLIIADEPTPGLDAKLARRVLSHFRELADDGAGVLLITHDLELALEVAERIVVMHDGTAVEDTEACNFAREETLQHPYTKALWRARL